jgi:hypothetical protein
MKLISASVPIVALSCCVAGSAVAAGTAKLSAPSKAHVGDSITAKGSGLKNGGSYALRLVDDAQPTQGASCLARIGKRQVASGGKVKISGTIPKKVTCYQGNGTKLGKIPVTPGKYHLLLSVPNGPTGSSAKYSFVRKALTIKKG